MLRSLTIAAALVTVLVASAASQVVVLQGGDSTMFDATGANAKLFFPASTFSIGAGMIDGHFVESFNEQRTWRGYDLSIGDSTFTFPLPTDFSGSTGLFTRGVTLGKVKDPFNPDSGRFAIFAGATAQGFFAPMFQGLKTNTPTMSAVLKRHLSKHFIFDSFNSFGTFKQSSIQSLTFVPVRDFRLAASAGFGSNSPFGAALLDYKRTWLHLRTSYAKEGKAFQTVILPLHQFVSQNAGLNVNLDIHPSNAFGLSAYHQNFFTFSNAVSQQATINGASVFGTVGFLTLNTSVFQSSTMGFSTHGESAGAQLRWTRITAGMEVMKSAFGTILFGNVTEQISHHIRVSQYLTETRGNLSASFGGEYFNNLISAGLGYQEMYNPFVQGTSPFQRVLSAHFSVTLSRGYSATVQTITTPDNKTKFMAYGGAYVNGPMDGANGMQHHNTGGKYKISGSVTDAYGPVEGVCVHIGKDVVFSDQQGVFESGANKDKIVPVSVDLPSSTMPGTWSVVSSPDQAAPGQEVKIVLTSSPQPQPSTQITTGATQ
jgi:hypothetical protein